MARTAAGDDLTEAHRKAQLQIRALALQNFTAIWPVWTGDERSFQRLLDVAVPVLRAHHTLSATLAAGYFTEFRAAEDPGGAAVPILPDPLGDDQIRGTLHVTGRDMTRQALAAGQPPQKAMQTAFVRTSGTATRLVMTGGRDTVLRSVGEDRRARGRWARVTGGKACAFCAMLASRGAAYLSEGTADFQAHDHCSCVAEPHYDGAALPPATEKWARLWDDAQREARRDGDLVRDTSNDALNAFRRHLSRQ